MLLHRSAKCRLRIFGHGIRLIENEDLIGRTRVAGDAWAHGRAGELFDFVADDTDAALIGGIQFQDT